MKAIRGGYLVHPDASVKFFTRRVSDADSHIFDQLRLCPLLFQEEIERQQELRVTVVEGKCFSMSIDCQELPEAMVDIRQLDFQRDRHRFALANGIDQIEAWSVAIVREFGLSYAALDWALSKSGQPFFLECNPLGSFKWSEICTGNNITREISEALLRRASPLGKHY